MVNQKDKPKSTDKIANALRGTQPKPETVESAVASIRTTDPSSQAGEQNTATVAQDTAQNQAPGKAQDATASSTPAADSPSSLSPEQPESLLPATQYTLPVVPIREGVLFPYTETVLTFGRPLSLRALAQANKSRNLVVLLTQKNARVTDPKPGELYQFGTLAVVERTLKTDDSLNTLVRGIGRVRVMAFTQEKPYYQASVMKIEDEVWRDDELTALVSQAQKLFRQTIQLGKPVEFLNFMRLLSGVSEGELADQIASSLTIKTEEKQEILETVDVTARLKLIIGHLTKELKIMEIEKDVVHKTQEKFDKHMRESVLRERLRTIQKELGELDEEEELALEYEKRLKKVAFPAEVRVQVKKELKRLKQMSVNNPETGYVKAWLDTMFDLPWQIYSDTNFDLKSASKTLDESHYGLEKVKDRILEFIAVLKLKQLQKGKDRQMPTILCFVGPPGVGKTSIGRSIAEALGRKFTKISLGGVRDEAEIRGHRRTYVGALPGRIIKGILQAKSSNPVFMLDEIDKLGNDFRGDPSSALLEVLDPEQNQNFEDHYLDVPYDLSQVLFITTANTLSTIPDALRDRLEIIRYSGYTAEEKLHITKDHLLQKVAQTNGLSAKTVIVPTKVISEVIQSYTREAGVRDLERQLQTIMRKIARRLVDSSKKLTKIKPTRVNKQSLLKYLGQPKYDVTLAEESSQVGLATGLAWTSVGGDVLFIEVALSPGKGQVKLTGKLGEVMRESAQAAFTYIRANAAALGIEDKRIANTDVHVHVPEGAVPKDGPSAGITIATALVSAFTQIPVRKDIAMTGEVTLRGRVLPIGGLKEKAIAGQAAGCTTIIFPKKNVRDLEEVPASVKATIKFVPVESVLQVLELALEKPLPKLQPKPTKRATKQSQS